MRFIGARELTTGARIEVWTTPRRALLVRFYSRGRPDPWELLIPFDDAGAFAVLVTRGARSLLYPNR